METVRNSIEVKVPVEEARQHWLDFVGGTKTASTSSAAGEEIPSGELPDEADKGMIYFGEEAADSTRVTLELRYNPDVLQEQGLDQNWIEKRIEQYLTRFKEQVER